MIKLMLKFKSHLVASMVVWGMLLPSSTTQGERSSSATAQAKVTVRKSILIVKTRDLDFGENFSGDPSLVVPPTSAQSAQFSVYGEPNQTYIITLPNTITMSTGDGAGADKQIVVNEFKSTPAASGRIGTNGMQNLNVGATRAALTLTQASGTYAGNVLVTVTY